MAAKLSETAGKELGCLYRVSWRGWDNLSMMDSSFSSELSDIMLDDG